MVAITVLCTSLDPFEGGGITAALWSGLNRVECLTGLYRWKTDKIIEESAGREKASERGCGRLTCCIRTAVVPRGEMWYNTRHLNLNQRGSNFRVLR